MSSGEAWMIRPSGPRTDELEEAIEILAPVRVVEPEDAAGWEALGREIESERPPWLIAAGGDGTVQGVVRLIGADAGIPLAILPGGTGNDFARALELPLKMVKVAQALADGTTDRRVDLLELTLDDGDMELVVNAVTVGLSGLAHTALTDEMKERWGRFAYLRAAIAATGELEPFAVELHLEGATLAGQASPWTGDLLHISIANGSTAGGGVPIAPEADIADGRIDICALAEAGWTEITSGIPTVLSGNEPDDSPWMMSRPLAVDVRLEQARDISVDGEVVRASRIRARVVQGGLLVRMPEEKPGLVARLLDGSDEG